MAVHNFYLNASTGNNLNAGDNSTLIVDTGGTLSGAGTSSTYTSLGSPFGGTNNLANQWVALSVAGDSAARFIGQIASNTASTLTFNNESATGSACTVLGSRAGLTTVNARVGGVWQGLGIYGLANTGVNAAMVSPLDATTAGNDIVLWFQAGTTYSQGATSVTMSAGLATHPIFWRGYNTTPGDLQDATTYAGLATTITNTATGAASTITGSLALPLISFSGTGQLTWGLYNNARSIAFFGSASSGTIAAAQLVFLDRCTVTTSSGNKTIQGAGGINASGCFFANSATTGNLIQNDGGVVVLTGCTFRGGANAIYHNTGTLNATLCILEGQSTNGVQHVSGSVSSFTNCTFSGWSGSATASGSGINFQYTTTGLCTVTNCIFSRYTGYGINAANTNRLVAWNNATYSLSGGSLVGPTAPASYNMIGGTVAESSNPFVNDTGHDYTLASTALARQAGFPGQFEV